MKNTLYYSDNLDILHRAKREIVAARFYECSAEAVMSVCDCGG